MIPDYEEFRKALNDLYTTPQGQLVIETLERTYAEANIFDVDTNTTMYRLGQKELIQNLVFEAKTKYEPVQSTVEE